MAFHRSVESMDVHAYEGLFSPLKWIGGARNDLGQILGGSRSVSKRFIDGWPHSMQARRDDQMMFTSRMTPMPTMRS